MGICRHTDSIKSSYMVIELIHVKDWFKKEDYS